MAIWKVELTAERIRIVYSVNDFIIKVVAIDKREDMEDYRIAVKRILSRASK